VARPDGTLWWWPGDATTVEAESTLDRTQRLATVGYAAGRGEPVPGADAADAVDVLLGLTAADAFGVADAALGRAVAYAKERHQFGVPIGSFQGVKHQLADLATEIEQSRALVWWAAHALDRIRDEAPLAVLL